MCGIAGIISGGSPDALKHMADIQSHRGPDDWGMQWFSEPQAGLAHRRLSIVDLTAAGHQPMPNKRGNRWITFNGEIYNFIDLRRDLQSKGHRFTSNSDTEVILAAYDEWGTNCVKRFNGMFAFAIYDTDTRELFIARDHLGIKPFYYAQRGETFVFASEAKAIFKIQGFEPEPEPDAILSSLLLLWVPEPKTGFKDVFKLPAGHYGMFKNGQLTLTEYWDVPIADTTSPKKKEGDYIDELRHLLEQAVRRQLMSDVPVGAFLSGGLDSSVIVALARKIAPAAKFSTYTICFSEADKKMEAMPDDAYYARRVAELYGTSHHEVFIESDINDLLEKMLWHLDDPIADGAAINTYLISKNAKENDTTVLLNGMGGDEVFGGYRKQLAAILIQRYQQIPKALRRGIIEPLTNALPVAIGGKGIRTVRWAKRFLRSASLSPMESFIYGFMYYTPDELRQIATPALLGRDFQDLYPVRRYYETLARVKHRPLTEQMTYLDTKLFLAGLNLCYSDKATMAASVEGRPPLIDKDIVEFAAHLPSAYKIRGREQKYLLKKAAEAYLPKEIIYRPKAPFGTPLRAWMKGNLGTRVRETFADKSQPHNSFFQSAHVLSMLDAHRKGSADYAHALWGVYATAKWINLNAKQIPNLQL
jgi:asparagine synthase (glutamine-hydrolysing)